MPANKNIIRVPYNIGQKVIIAGVAATIDQIVYSSLGLEYRIWYMAQEQMTYCYVTGDKISGAEPANKIGFLLPN